LRDYAFLHRVWYVAVDLDELDAVDRSSRLLSYQRRGVLRLLDRDHLGEASTRLGLRAAVREHLAAGGWPQQDWRITLITYPRVIAYVFNPVSFYLCHDRSGALRHVLAEVHNTHGEREVYDFPAPTIDAADGPVFRSTAEKRFYVSPFIGPRATYELTVVETVDQLAITIHETEAEGPALDAGVRLRRLPLTDRSLARLLARDPVMPLKTIALIAGHVARLRLGGLRWDRFRRRSEYRDR